MREIIEKGHLDQELGEALNWVSSFMDENRLWPKSGKANVAVSGGMDSMFLLLLMWGLRQRGLLQELKCFHVDHGTRTQGKEEWKLVKETCEHLSIPFHGEHLNLDLKSPNFEARARKERGRFFTSLCERGDLVFTGHHIDDSFEWSLMCQWKSQGELGQLGIPVINNNVARPLMCLSRKQIEHFVKKFQIPFLEDASNRDISYERNYVRNRVVPTVAERYPQYLKHYVLRSNKMASDLGQLRKGVARGSSSYYDLGEFGTLVFTPSFKKFNSQDTSFLAAIKKHSNKERGNLHRQLLKIESALRSGKEGPLSLSGGVKVFLDKHFIILCNETGLKAWEDLDNELIRGFFSKGPFVDSTYQSLLKFPWNWSPIVLCPKLGVPGSGRKKILNLLPKTSKLCLQRSIWFQSPGALEAKKLLKQGSEIVGVKTDPEFLAFP